MSRGPGRAGAGRKGWGVSSQEWAPVTEWQPYDTSPVSPCGSSMTPHPPTFIQKEAQGQESCDVNFLIKTFRLTVSAE